MRCFVGRGGQYRDTCVVPWVVEHNLRDFPQKASKSRCDVVCLLQVLVLERPGLEKDRALASGRLSQRNHHQLRALLAQPNGVCQQVRDAHIASKRKRSQNISTFADSLELVLLACFGLALLVTPKAENNMQTVSSHVPSLLTPPQHRFCIVFSYSAASCTGWTRGTRR